MLKYLFLLLPVFAYSQQPAAETIERWQAQAKAVTIHEDQWGVPHIYGKKDADAVFGLMYVQCAQNFARVERNYIEMLGRTAEVDGESRVYDDLMMRLIYDSAAAKRDYVNAEPWLKKLLNAFADGVNYYLYKHPAVKPVLLKEFQPWFPLMYTDGSINPTQTGGLTVRDLRNFYEGRDEPTSFVRPELSINEFTQDGSNGFAIGPRKSASGNTMLYINPHVTFYFRTEVHMVSEEGLNAYGAVTWGQFFVYQGFNAHCGWMHTSSYADVADVYEETVGKDSAYVYNSAFPQYSGYMYFNGQRSRPIKERLVNIKYKHGSFLSSREFTTYSTGHGPVLGKRKFSWLTLKEKNRSIASLMQSWLRTKANGFNDFEKIMKMRANNSNNTVFADSRGNIAYWHGNFIPKRNPKYDWSLPVDGNTDETGWQGLHNLNETVHIYNPASGWIQNCNSTPFTAAGNSSPVQKNYPTYMAPDGQNGRALNAIRLLDNNHKLSLDSLIALGYNTHLTAFDSLLPALFRAYDQSSAASLKTILGEPLEELKQWNKEASINSIATTLAIEWAQKLSTKIPPATTAEAATNAVANFQRMAALPNEDLLVALQLTIGELEKAYGSWRIPWGNVNRYQRSLTNAFSDSVSSLPVGLAPGTWGCLPSYVSRRFGTENRYGYSGNSFVAAVEFGKRIKAKTIITGGESFDPASPHHADQAEGFINGKFKDVNFYKDDVLKNTKRMYHPGD